MADSIEPLRGVISGADLLLLGLKLSYFHGVFGGEVVALAGVVFEVVDTDGLVIASHSGQPAMVKVYSGGI